MIAIIDYDLGNLNSVQRAFHFLVNLYYRRLNEIERARYLIHLSRCFWRGINLRKKGLIEPLLRHKENSIMGICLGMQLLLGESEELEGSEGLNLIPGKVKYFHNLSEFDFVTKSLMLVGILEQNNGVINIQGIRKRYMFILSTPLLLQLIKKSISLQNQSMVILLCIYYRKKYNRMSISSRKAVLLD